MNLKKMLLLVTVGFLMLAGCSDDDPINPIPEDADDNFITSVVLTVGETSYAAAIEGNDITVTVPYNVSLDGAAAEFKYTPSATIMPDPAEITDWNTERQFRVTSYNGRTNDYKYLVVKDDIREEGDVVLKTDAEVKAFADKGVTIIKGDLIVGEASGDNFVTNIEALSALTQVEGDIVINDTYKGTTLDGLENVVKIGGLHIGSTEAASTASELYYANLRSLEEIAGDITICNDKLQWFEAEKLTAIGGSLVMRSAALTSVTTPALATVGSDFELQGSNEEKAGGDMTIVEMKALASVGGKINIKNFAKLNAVKFEALTSAGAVLLPTIPYEFETISLPVLSKVGGDIQLIANTDATSIGGMAMNTGVKTIDMNSLSEVDGTIVLSAFAELREIPSLNGIKVKGIELVSLSKVPDPLNLSQTTFSGGGRLLLTNMNLIATLTLPVQADVTLELRYNKLLGKVDGVEELAGLVYVPGTDCSFSSLKSVRGDVSFSNGPQTTISTPQLEKVGGNLLNDVEKIGYPKLIEVGGYLAVSDNVSDDSGTACDFRVLRKIGGQLYFDSTNIYAAIDMPELEEIGTAADPAYYKAGANDKYYKEALYGSCALTSYDGLHLPKLRKIGGAGFTLDLGLGGGMSYLEELSLPLLEEVDGIFQIHQNGPGMTPAAPLERIALPVIAKIGSVHIEGCSVTDFSAFAPVVGQLSDETWFVHEDCSYSPTWQDMKNGKYKKE
ncbi:MAG TPA: hypothetical protein PKZ47_05225 [Alistipes sp.]|uniref:hypothetical protein n=1 Tax=Alistipes sp. TaxID=1872444 RepID=UPI002B62B050|nr:hypothetical protein [Alistipes sp.]HUN14414.1 hypothetical protein [Alistipes sp.]